MSLNFSKSTFLFMLSLTSLIYSCTQRQDYAPVITTLQRFNAYHQDNQNQNQTPLNNQQKPEVILQTPPEDSRKLIERKIRLFNPHPSKKNVELNPKSLNLMDNASTKLKKNILVNSNVKANNKGNKSVSELPKPQKKSANNKKKSIISIDNKNMLMLHFQWPLKGKIKKDFFQTNRKGIDIVGKIGQTVRASEAGKVVYCGQGIIGFGNTIVIKHNDTYLSAYANNSNLLVKEGEFVNKGQNIANAGMSVSKKAMLHFEIRKNGKSVDPLTLLPEYD